MEWWYKALTNFISINKKFIDNYKAQNPGLSSTDSQMGLFLTTNSSGKKKKRKQLKQT